MGGGHFFVKHILLYPVVQYVLLDSTIGDEDVLRLLHTMNVRFSLLDIVQRILGVTLPNFQ
jgi:hypothetical protein